MNNFLNVFTLGRCFSSTQFSLYRSEDGQTGKESGTSRPCSVYRRVLKSLRPYSWLEQPTFVMPLTLVRLPKKQGKKWGQGSTHWKVLSSLPEQMEPTVRESSPAPHSSWWLPLHSHCLPYSSGKVRRLGNL